MAEEYIYAVARVRGRELKLLNASVLDSLVSAQGMGEALRVLADHGWDGAEGTDTDAMFSAEREKTWEFISELVPDMSVFDVFLYANDYHNLKAAVKETARMETRDSVFIGKGECTIDPELIRRAVARDERRLLVVERQKRVLVLRVRGERLRAQRGIDDTPPVTTLGIADIDPQSFIRTGWKQQISV